MNNLGKLTPDITRIVKSKDSRFKTVRYSGIILNTESDLQYPLRFLNTVEILSDFNGKYTDFVLISTVIPLGDFVKVLNPLKDNLDIRLTKESGSIKVRDTMKLTILSADASAESGDYSNKSRDDLNKEGMVNIEFQCINRVAFILRMAYSQAIYHDCRLKDAIYFSYNELISKTTIDGKPLDVDIKIDTPDNNRVYHHIEVPNNVDLMNMPTSIQNGDYGLYNGDIGTYLNKAVVEYKKDPSEEEYKDTLWVYPLYKKIEENVKTKEMFVYAANMLLSDLTEYTYLNSKDRLEIIVNENSTIIDERSKNTLNYGAGFTAMKADSILKRKQNFDSKNITLSRDDTTMDQSIKSRNDGLDYSANKGISDNMYVERSKLLKDNAMPMQFKWNYSRPELIEPDMVLTYIYIDKTNTIKRVRGNVQSVFTIYNNDKKMSSSLVNVTLTDI